MEPVPLRKPPTPLYTAEVDLSETGGTIATLHETSSAWGASTRSALAARGTDTPPAPLSADVE